MGYTRRQLKRQNRSRKRVEKTLRSTDFSVYANLQPTRRLFNLRGRQALEFVSPYDEKEAQSILEQRFGSETGKVMVLYHGTPRVQNLQIISRRGFQLGSTGMFGGGIYFGNRAKALSFARGTGALLQCAIALGRCWRPVKTGPPPQGFHSIHGTHLTKLRREEWCVYDPKRVIILRVYLFPWRDEMLCKWERERHNLRLAFGRGEIVPKRKANDPVVQKILSKPAPEGYRRKSDKKKRG